MRKKANQQSGLHEAGLLERMRRQSLMQLLFLLLLRCQVMLERLGSPRALASPGARVGSAPLPDTLDVGGACAVSAVAWLLEPAGLAGGVPRLAALGLGAVALAPGATRVGSNEGLPVLALTLGEWTSHGPASPPAHAQGIGAWKKETSEEKSAPKTSKANGTRG